MSSSTPLWLEETPDPSDIRRLEGTARADVCVVGGGLTGLWTAIHLKRRDPALEVALVEAETCGFGASGRNGGFVLTWWAKFQSLRKVCGVEEAIRLAKASERVISEELPRFCADHAIDPDLRLGGWLWAATSEHQLGAWAATVSELARHDVHPFQALSPSDVARLSGSSKHLAGVFEPTAATVQPAKLTRGLRRVALDAGVSVYERSRMTGLDRTATPCVRTAAGTLRADRVVLALNAWTAAIPELRRALVVITSDMVATEPIPERLAASGLPSGVAISDSRLMVNYYRATVDGRVAFGKGGGSLCFGKNVRSSFTPPDQDADATVRSFRTLYPELAGARITHRWSGPIDRSVTGLPFFGALRNHPGVYYGAGFSGNGVGPSYLGGEILASMALGLADEWTASPLASGPYSRFPPEPARYVGGRIVKAAVARKESAEDRNRRVGRLTRFVAGLAPAGLVPVEPAVPVSRES
jgi:putative aminophosphonate oxidoreductase